MKRFYLTALILFFHFVSFSQSPRLWLRSDSLATQSQKEMWYDLSGENNHAELVNFSDISFDTINNNLGLSVKNSMRIEVNDISSVSEKIKTSTQYMLPYRSRGYGKSIMEDYIVEIGIMESQIIIFDTIKSKVDFIDYDLPMFPYSYKYFMKNDTLFSYKIYGKWEYNKRKRTHEIQVDSIRLSKKEYVKLRKNKYIEIYIDYGTDTVCNMVKFKKKKNSKWFLENNEKWFQADYEVKRIFLKKYSSDGKKEKQTLKTK